VLKVVIAIVVYDRYKNIEKWLHCWKQCKQNAELVIIHNYNEDERIKELCEANGVQYIRRKNIGFDIGAFQDVCRERLQGFPEFDYIIWLTDDVMPMSKDFVTPFIDAVKKNGVGLSCMKISKEYAPHVRTSMFCVSKETSLKITFSVDPIVTKQDCYYFEHRGRINTLTNQIRWMGLSCEQVGKDKDSLFWDTGFVKRLNRQKEWNDLFVYKEDSKVTFICTIYQSFPQIISSLLMQTYKNWELLLLHDGPNDTGLKEIVENYNDKRVIYIESEVRKNNFGHHLRDWALEEIKAGKLNDTDYIVITNADNYHVPVYCEYMLKGFKSGTVATYCSDMVHSYQAWKIIPVELKRGFVDCAGVMVKKDAACSVGWKDMSHSSDWTYFNKLMNKYGKNNFAKVTGCLLTHN